MVRQHKNSQKKWLTGINAVWKNLGIAATIISTVIVIMNSAAIKHCTSKEKKENSVKKSVESIPHKSTQKEMPVKDKNKPLSRTTAVLIVDDKNVIDRSLGGAFVGKLQGKGVKVSSPRMFSASFLSTGEFTRFYNGDSTQTILSRLSRQFKMGVLGRKAITYIQNEDYSDLVTALIVLKLHFVSSKNGAVLNGITFSSNGAGFSNTEARRNAEENILKKFDSQLPKIVNFILKH